MGALTFALFSQLGIVTTIAPSADPLVPPLHASSSFARLVTVRLSFHAVYITVLMLAWRTYRASEGMSHNILTGLWLVSLSSIVSSRIDFTADVVRGTIFAFVIFFFYLHMHNKNGNADERSGDSRRRGIFRSNSRRRLRRSSSVKDSSSRSRSGSNSADLSLKSKAKDEVGEVDGEDYVGARSHALLNDAKQQLNRMRSSYLNLMKQT